MRTFYHNFPIQITKMKTKINFHHHNTRKDLGFRILVKSSQYKGEGRNSKFEKLIELCRVNVTGVYARSCDMAIPGIDIESMIDMLYR